MNITICDLANSALLKAAWLSVRRKKSKEVAKFSRGIDDVTILDFEKNAPSNLITLANRLESGEYTPQPVKIHLEKKDSGKYRMIAIPTIEDRIVQRGILTLFEPYIFPVINNGVSYCGVRDDEDEPVNTKNAIEKIIKHIEGGHFWIFESDIVSFYDKIPKTAILNKLKNLIPMDERLYTLLNKYVYYEIGNKKIFEGKEGVTQPDGTLGITQGSALSPILANLYLSDFDTTLKAAFGDRFIRYVDDFIVMCKTEKEALIAKELALQEITKENLQLSPDAPKEETKTHIRNLKAYEKVDFLGISIHQRGLTPKKGIHGAKKHMENILRRKDKNGKNIYKRLVLRNNKKLDVADQMEEKIKSWGEHYRFYHVKPLYAELDKYIEEKTKKMRDVRPIKPLNKIALSPLKSLKEWMELFKK
jgi:group II intron reverse transcriptase/maturase